MFNCGENGASCHITNNDYGMVGVKAINNTVNGSSGKMKSNKLEIKQVDGTKKVVL